MDRQLIRALGNKIYQNYLMGSRVHEFRSLLEHLKGSGHAFLTVAESAAAVRQDKLPERVAVIRCDIDSDVATALDMFAAAKEVGAVVTWYWRLSTLDRDAMCTMALGGHEIGYHFEELAVDAKATGAKTASQVLQRIGEIQEQFCRNLEEKYVPAAGTLPKTVASHGDFVNRKLKQTNSVIIDETIRQKYGIEAEAYDPWLNAPVTRRFADSGPPHWWKPRSPFEAAPSGSDFFYVLVHPRQFRARVVENTMLDGYRLYEGVTYKLKTLFR